MSKGELRLPIRVFETAYLHKVSDPEQLKSGFAPLDLTSGARQVGGTLLRMLNGDPESRRELEITLNEGAPKIGYKRGVSSGRLPNDLKEMERTIDDIQSQVAHDKFSDFYINLVDGSAMAVQFEVIRGNDALKDALDNKRFSEVDEMLGGGVMKGMGEKLSKWVITDSELITVMLELNLQLENDRFSRESADKMGRLIQGLYLKRNVNTDQVAAVQQYYNWALEDSGMVTNEPDISLRSTLGLGGTDQFADYDAMRKDEARRHIHIVSVGREEW